MSLAEKERNTLQLLMHIQLLLLIELGEAAAL